MVERFAAQRLLAEAPLLRGVEAERLLGALDAAARVKGYRHPVALPGQAPELLLTISSPGRLSYAADPPFAGAAAAALDAPPRQVASLSFDRLSNAGAPSPGILKQLAAELPVALKRSGLRPGDMVQGYPEGSSWGDYRRALAFMTQGMGPLDSLQHQRAWVRPDFRLSPALLYPVDEGFAERLGWYPPLAVA